ncbi:MAG: ferritin-like domain-containing protein [Thermoanaerobaculaceae bacterium]|nr:ferritin-like domain-containing protein [Thermoanaerobaculaceae bacterium]
MKDAVAAELTPHATEELDPATLPIGRIIRLGGTPATGPKRWFPPSPCACDASGDPYVAVVRDRNIGGRQGAIGACKKLMDVTTVKDTVTYNLALAILEQEVGHEKDLQSLEENLDLMVACGSTEPRRPRRAPRAGPRG